MRKKLTSLGAIVLVCLLLNPTTLASIVFQTYRSGTTDTSVLVAPGAAVNLDVIAVSIGAEPGVEGNLDSFTYRLEFSNSDFVLSANNFAAPFDNTLAPAGFNGSVPWAGLPIPITSSVDVGSPRSTPLVADLYRTTASTAGIPGLGPNLLLETLTVQAPLADGEYLIQLNVLEAADRLGAFHSVEPGIPFVVIVPEPWTGLLVGSATILSLLRRRISSLSAGN